MSKSLKLFENRLKDLIKRGLISKSELHRKTGLSRSSIDGYLEGADPGVEGLDKIASALNMAAVELIDPGSKPAPLSSEDARFLARFRTLNFEEKRLLEVLFAGFRK
jgi:transcriptional regulator with XRE-family HTH domain